MSCSIFHTYSSFGHISSAFKLAGGPLETREHHSVLSCGAHSASGWNQSRLMNIRRLYDVVTLKEKERNFCVVAHRGSATDSVVKGHTSSTIGFHYANNNSRAKIIDTNTNTDDRSFFWAWIRICLPGHYFYYLIKHGGKVSIPHQWYQSQLDQYHRYLNRSACHQFMEQGANWAPVIINQCVCVCGVCVRLCARMQQTF